MLPRSDPRPDARLQRIQEHLQAVRDQQAKALAEIERRQAELKEAQAAAVRRARERVALERAEFLRIRDEIRRRLFS